ncbi:hypothetical protein NX862_09595 [Rhodobacter sp. KR11]|uniref:DUF6985 domain-containing protein n=1 Tax=Rhodobacter sp. KR11 TaxID=2974588 RepID=UPI0022221B87|nr:hypothetical protein [Rhodobacter sp. KR11]MCW1919009.1 hypothetical protein [Rhodobacter sp. KR11]
MKKHDALNLLASAKKGVPSKTVDGIAVPFLGDIRLPITFFAEDIELDLAADAIVAFCATSPAMRATIQEHLFKAAQKSFEDNAFDFKTPQDQIDESSESSGRFTGAKVPTASEQIWLLVDLTSIHIEPSWKHNNQHVLRVNGECAWDCEHGVEVTFAANGSLVGAK